MKSVLEELYAGNIRPTDKVFDKKSKVEKLYSTVDSLEDELRKMFNDEQKRLYQEDMERFIDGFKLGLCIAIEALRDGDRDLRDIK